MYSTLLWDCDGTLLNFKKSEYHALKNVLESLGLPNDNALIEDYSVINDSIWKKIERCELEKESALVKRFELFLEKNNLDGNPSLINSMYRDALSEVFFYEDDSLELCKKIRESGIRQYIVTNGAKTVQTRKLILSGFDAVADGVFISDCIGVEKPQKGFFDAVRSGIPDFDPAHTLLCGDSLTSDIKGAIDAGIPCCRYDPELRPTPSDCTPDYVIASLWDILKIL